MHHPLPFLLVRPAVRRCAAGAGVGLLAAVGPASAQAQATGYAPPAGGGRGATPPAAPRVPVIDRNAPVGDAPASQTVTVTAPARPAPGSPSTLSGRDAQLTARERRAVGISRDWIGSRDMPTPGDEGVVVFTFGATLPSIVCAPLYVCDLSLQPGEVVNDINLGDAVRWRISPAASGSGVLKTTHVLLKPTDAGLSTNLVITTDRRTYVLKLVSRSRDWMPRVAFTYPDDVQGQWAAFRAQQEQERAGYAAAAGTGTRAGRLATGEALAALDFDYRVEGDRPRWRPIRVYTDRVKTYIQFPDAVSTGEVPALVALGLDGREQLVNYRMVGDRFVVDRVLERAVLLTGVGKRQQRVELVHQPREE